MSSFPNNNRGGFAARRGRGGQVRSSPKSQPVKPDIQKYPLGQLLQSFYDYDFKAEKEKIDFEPLIVDCQYVASYNWLNHKTPTIMVPGKPPHWTPLPAPERLSEDIGDYFRDPNAARFPKYPVAPAVQAILSTDPDFQTDDVDLFACGSTLGNLLRFVRGGDKPFRFNVEVTGNTIFFVRKENDPRELILGIHGFGHSFPEAYTTWDKEVKGSETHQRIVRYRLGRISCLVRFECDGYLKDNDLDVDTSNLCLTMSNVSDSNFDGDKLLGILQDTTVTQQANETSANIDRLTLKRGGSAVPQSSIFDLKTRSARYKTEIEMGDLYPLLWIKQIPNFIIAYHDGAGLFRDIRVQDISKDVSTWEKENITTLVNFSKLLEKIIEFARSDTRGLLEVYFSGQGGLQIRSQYGQGMHALPADLMEKWASDKTKLDSAERVTSNDDDGDPSEAFDSGFSWRAGLDEDVEPDYTACSAEDCGYCGKCTY